MRKFIVYLSYIGTKYRGISKAGNGLPSVIDSLEKSMASYSFKMKPSSRTDAGVHAVTNTLYLTLTESDKYSDTDLTKLRTRINNVLRKNADEIRVSRIVEVPRTLPSVVCRRYMYRLGLRKSVLVKDGIRFTQNESIFLEDKCYIVYPPFDVDLFLEAAELISGRQDVRHFTFIKGLREFKPDYIRDISVTVKRAHPHTVSSQPEVMKNMEFLDIHFESRAYVFRQIRNIVGFMVSYAKRKLDFQEAKIFLQDEWTSENIGKRFLKPAPPSALHLLDIEYATDDSSSLKEDLPKPYMDLLSTINYLRYGVTRYAKDDKIHQKNPGSTTVQQYIYSIYHEKGSKS